MSHDEKLAGRAPKQTWTRPEAYVGALARKRSFRLSRRAAPRTQPESPRVLLSTAPFLVLIAFLGVLAVAIMIIAFPGNQPPPKPSEAVGHQQGVAERGWFQEAQKDMH